MFDLEPGAYFCHYVVIQVKAIIGYDSFWKSISTYNLFLDEPDQHCLCHTSIWRRFHSFGKVVDDYKDETMAIWGFGVIGPITSMPHIEKGHGDAITFKDVGGTCILST